MAVSYIGSPSEPLNVSVNVKKFGLLTINWIPPLDCGNPYLEYYELGFDNVASCLSSSTTSHTFTGPFQSSSHILTLSAVSVFNGQELKSAKYIIRVKVFSKWIIFLIIMFLSEMHYYVKSGVMFNF